MKRTFSIIALLTLILASCTTGGSSDSTTMKPTEEKKVRVVTTIAPLASFAKAVGGDLVEVENLVPVGMSEHTWEPKPSDMRILHEADMVIKNGLDLEPFLEKMLASREEVMVVDTSVGVEALHPEDFMGSKEEEHEEEHHNHGASDPHIWLSPQRARIQVKNITDALIQYDPAHADIYRERASAYDQRLVVLEQEIREQFASQEKKPFIVFHDAYQYYLKDFGLSEWRKGAIQSVPGKEPSPAYLQQLTTLLEKEGVGIIFVEPQFSKKTVEVLEQEYTITVALLDPTGLSLSETGYEENMRAITKAILDSFTKK